MTQMNLNLCFKIIMLKNIFLLICYQSVSDYKYNILTEACLWLCFLNYPKTVRMIKMIEHGTFSFSSEKHMNDNYNGSSFMFSLMMLSFGWYDPTWKAQIHPHNHLTFFIYSKFVYSLLLLNVASLTQYQSDSIKRLLQYQYEIFLFSFSVWYQKCFIQSSGQEVVIISSHYFPSIKSKSKITTKFLLEDHNQVFVGEKSQPNISLESWPNR